MTTNAKREAYGLAAKAIKRIIGELIGAVPHDVLQEVDAIHAALKAAASVANGPGIDDGPEFKYAVPTVADDK